MPNHAAGTVPHIYDRYSHPPPISTLDHHRRRRDRQQTPRAEFHLFWPSRPYKADLSILIAGCGTSQAARHALRWPSARVTGIDVSGPSLRCSEDLKRKYDLRNLEVHELPIERARELGLRFDLIVCTGVLHHLADPDAGLAALREVLEPDGAMHLMVYAPYGQTGMYMLQQFCRRLGIRAADDEIRDLIAALRQLPSDHPLEALLRDAPDLREEGALADALLHPQDRAYSVPQLLELIERADLTFRRWVRQAPYSPRCGVMAQIPQASRLTELSMASQYAAVELFRGTMVRHSAVVHRHDNADEAQPGSFTGEFWMDYIPFRMSDTICVQDRLPPGAAGVLINQAQTCRDLVVPLDALEKRMFDAIDGVRTIREIVDQALPSSQPRLMPELARTFFERLWWYDHVVFDASRRT